LKAQELREYPVAELQDQLRRVQKDLFDLRFQQASKQLNNPMRLRQLRHDIARIKTLIRERELAEQPASRRKK